jgi:streptogrisin C
MQVYTYNIGDRNGNGGILSPRWLIFRWRFCRLRLLAAYPLPKFAPDQMPGFGQSDCADIRHADQDVELHTSGYVESAEFYADTTASARILTGKRLQSSTAAGNQVCHRGEATGYSCGLVALTNFKPTYANACGAVTCDSVWVKVNGDAQTACFQGDSGGPVFASQTAFGLLKGTSASGKAKGQCTWFAYMSTDRLPTGWSLVFG